MSTNVNFYQWYSGNWIWLFQYHWYYGHTTRQRFARTFCRDGASCSIDDKVIGELFRSIILYEILYSLTTQIKSLGVAPSTKCASVADRTNFVAKQPLDVWQFTESIAIGLNAWLDCGRSIKIRKNPNV